MPKLITQYRRFLDAARRKDARHVKIFKSGTKTKFKIRCSKYLYVMVLDDAKKAEKMEQSLPPGLQKFNLPKKA